MVLSARPAAPATASSVDRPDPIQVTLRYAGPTLWGRLLLICALAFGAGLPWSADAADAEAIARGKYLFDAAGCVGCHTDSANKGAALAGGRRLKTPFGDFLAPNITSDPVHGIGKWTDADFIRALREGKAPDGSSYYPAFPYPSYTGMVDRDILDIKAYIFSLPPSATPNKPHELKAPYNIRLLNFAWKSLFFTAGPMAPDLSVPRDARRGSYLVNAVAHCGECHTDRNMFGAKRRNVNLAGASTGPEGGSVPNITPHEETGIGKWSLNEITDLLKDGLKPDGDVVGSGMDEVVANSTSKLTDEDLASVAAYLKILPAINSRPGR